MWWLLGLLAIGGGAALLAAREPDEETGKLIAKAASANAIRNRPKVEQYAGRNLQRISPAVTAADLATLMREAIYIGPLDTPQMWEQIEALGRGPNSENARVALMMIGRDAVALGLDGNPWKVPPKEDGNAVQAWNWKQVLMADAIIDLWIGMGTAPKRHNIRLYNADLLHFAQKMIAHPDCAAFRYFERTADQIYERNGTPSCEERRQSYNARLKSALRNWASDEGLLWRDVGWERWRYDIPTWGDDYEQRSLVYYLEPELRAIARDKMVVWPGGAPVNPQDDDATQAAIAFAIIVAIMVVGPAA